MVTMVTHSGRTVLNGRNVQTILTMCSVTTRRSCAWSAAKTLVAAWYAHHTVGLDVEAVMMQHAVLVLCASWFKNATPAIANNDFENRLGKSGVKARKQAFRL